MHVVQISAVAMPEITHLRFQVDQFETVGKTMVHVLDMFVMNTVALDEASLYAVKECLFNARQLGMGEQVPRHAGA
jgi:hypothetical protein